MYPGYDIKLHLVGWLVDIISTLFGSFNSKLSQFDKSLHM